MTGKPSRAPISGAARTPTQPGRITEDPTVPVRRSTGPGRPIPAPSTRSRGTPASARTAATSAAARSSASSARWSTSSASSRSARTVEDRSATATRRWEWSKSMPTAAPADGSSASSMPGRPGRERSSPRSVTSPRSTRSATRLETVERESPVARARSARLAVPARRRASTSRARLPSRRASSAPSVLICQGFERRAQEIMAPFVPIGQKEASFLISTRRLSPACALLAALAVALPATAGAAGRCGAHPWCNTALSPDARAGLLLDALSDDEKVSLLAGDEPTGVLGGENTHTGTSNGVPRVDLPTTYYSDGPVGPRQGQVTAMPIPMALAATFDKDLAYKHGATIGNEVKMKGNDVVFAPTVNVMRVPYNGRTFEAYGEDPWLVARTTVAWVQGAQSEGIIANVKHFAANNQEGESAAAQGSNPSQPLGPPPTSGNRMTVNAQVDERTLREVYLPQFEAAVKEGRAGSVMCSYNRLNGVYACENKHLLEDILKGDWGFMGYALADYGATHNTDKQLNNGLDFEPWPGVSYSPTPVNASVAAGRASMRDVDEHVRRILRTLFAYGFFDRAAYTNQTDKI